jgi:hypothetical protein
MLIVGSDRIAVAGLTGAPEGPRHAVDVNGRVLCRTSRARFTWPGLSWESVAADDGACRLCAQVRNAQEALSQVDPYPTAVRTEAPQPAPAFAPWQPGPGLFVPNEQ